MKPRHLRLLLVVLALGLIAQGCLARRGEQRAETEQKTFKYGDPNAVGKESPAAASPKAPSAVGEKGDTASSQKSSTTPKASSRTAATSDHCTRVNDVIGSPSRGLLAAGPYTEIVLEFDYVGSERRPSAAVTSAVRAYFEEVMKKKVTLAGGNEIAPYRARYGKEDLQELSERRTIPTRAPRASIWIGYLNGESVGNPRASGVVWQDTGTTVAIFVDQIRGASTAALSETVERGVVTHEIGHVLSLVSLDYPDIRKHEDKEHSGHSSNRSSVMYYAWDHVDALRDILGDSTPLRFDQNDLADLEDLGACRL